jgi:predicted O-linked N-acetylglucosamine transferase (SPINDLY family)
LSDRWFSTIGESDDRVAQQVYADQVDILVDLAGHTVNNRLRVLALKPAPVQVTYLGYPSTTGLSQINYRFTDQWADPPGHSDPLYTEKLIRLPHSFLCYQAPEDAPEVAALPSLSSGYITFGSFNTIQKVNEEVIALWSKLLTAIPSAHLLLKCKSFSDRSTMTRYRDQFTTYGINPERLNLVGHQQATQDHLSLYHQVDIALDPFPYNGTTTTCEALWMGVPVITLAGNSHVSRVGVSLLKAVDLPDLIAATPENYVDKAIALAKDLEQLAQLRGNLRLQMAQSPLCNASQFVNGLEQVYRQLWQHWGDRSSI